MMRMSSLAIRRLCVAASVCVALIAHAASLPAAQAPAGFIPRTFNDDTGKHKYVVFVPANYSPQHKWPTILFLHGAGERGNDGQLQLSVGLGPLVRLRQNNFPFIVVFPQAEDVRGRILTGWSLDTADGKRALAILDQVEKDFAVDTRREILTGWSMGGYGVWNMAAEFPNRWWAVAPISGGGDEALADKLTGSPLWAMHGVKDRTVSVEGSRKLVAAVKKAGGKPHYTEFPDIGHDVWKVAYNQDALYAWMLDPQKFRDIEDPLANSAGRATAYKTLRPDFEPPFVPALDVPNAIYVRLGNDMLATLSDAIPSVVPRDMLTGQLNDIADFTSSQGYSFSVYFSGITYSGQLARAVVRAYARDRLNVQLGLSNVVITIGSTSVTGEGLKSAAAGPMSIVMGHQRPVWLSFDVTPVVVQRKLRLKLLGTAFQIPNDNWYVTAPAGVSTRGLGMTSDKVSSGLVSGLYGSKARLEQEVVSVVPGIVTELEKRLDISQTDQVVTGVWPLPVYQPRLRVWPAEASTDERGVTVILGVTAAAVDPQKPPRQVQVVPPVGPPAGAVPTTTRFQFGLAPRMLGPLSEMLVQADVARIHVLDTPSKSLHQLVDPKVVSEILPDLKRHGDKVELWTELVLAAPIQVNDVPQNPPQLREGSPSSPVAGATAVSGTVQKNGSSEPLQFDVSRLLLAVSIRTDPASAKWTPYAEFDVKLQQGARPQLDKTAYRTRTLALQWDDDAHISAKGRFVAEDQPRDSQVNVQRFEEIFTAGWKEFLRPETDSHTVLPDIEFGITRLRAAEVTWAAPALTVTYAPAGVRIINRSKTPLVYETKGPYSDWGGPYTLPPGEDHDYPIAYPLTYRRRMERGIEIFTLPAGSVSDFFVPAGSTSPGLYEAREPVKK